jgi:oligoendopeptidase F
MNLICSICPVQKLETNIQSLDSALKIISVENLPYVQKQILDYSKAYEIFYNLRVYLVAHLSLDTSNERAKIEESKVSKYGSNLNQTSLELMYFVGALNQEQLNVFFSNPDMKAYEFSFQYFRQRMKQLLPKDREKLISQMSQFGPQAFSNLYEEISGKARLDLPSIKDKKLSKAETMNMLYHANPELRKEA